MHAPTEAQYMAAVAEFDRHWEQGKTVQSRERMRQLLTVIEAFERDFERRIPMRTNPASDAARFWNERYDVPEFIFGTQPNTYLTQHADLLKPGMRALAVADGEGRNSVWMARLGLTVDAFDLSSVAIGKAKMLASDAGVLVNFSISDCDTWDWQASSYDVIAAIFIQFADPAMRARLFARMTGALKPGGILILQGYVPKQLELNTGGPGVLENLYTEEMLRSAFAALEITELAEYEAELQEGSRHTGRSALIGMVARRLAMRDEYNRVIPQEAAMNKHTATNINSLDEHFAVSPQVLPTDLPAIAAAGYKSIICNRPDGEAGDQPSYRTLEFEAQLHGIVMHYLPILPGQATDEAVTSFGRLTDEMPKPVLAYCRTGMRSATLWALSRRGFMEPDDILARAAGAGFDLGSLASRLAAQA